MRPKVSSPPAVWQRWGARVLLATALAVSLAYVPYRLLDPVGRRHISELRRDLTETRAETDRLRSLNNTYRREVEGLRNDPQAIEGIARDDLGMVRPDEIVIRFEGERRR